MRARLCAIALSVVLAGGLVGACGGEADLASDSAAGEDCAFPEVRNPTWAQFRTERLRWINEVSTRVAPDAFEDLMPGEPPIAELLEDMASELDTKPFQSYLESAPPDATAQLMTFMCENPELGKFASLADGVFDPGDGSLWMTLDTALEICMQRDGVVEGDLESIFGSEIVAASSRLVCPRPPPQPSGGSA